MKSHSSLHYLKFFFLYLFSFLLIFLYLFLIVWTWCYTLFVCYLLLAAFSACFIIYWLYRSKRHAIRFLLLGLFLFCILSPFNLKQYNRHAAALQERVNHKEELTTKEKMGIYGCVLMIAAFEAIPFPEAAIQNYYLLFPSPGGQRIFYRQSILQSPSIKQAILLKEKGFISWNRWNFVRNKDFRFALAFHPCTVSAVDKQGYKEVTLTTRFGYRENVVTTHAGNFLRGIFAFRVDEGLFFYLEQRGWLHPYKSVWIAKMK